jgi:hypothetical protein
VARAAIEKQEGVGKIFVTGARAWFVMEGDVKPDEAKLKADYEAGRLSFESLEAEERPRAKAGWIIESGFG